MFGFFRKKEKKLLIDMQERLINYRIFLVNFNKMFDKEHWEKPLPEKIWIYVYNLSQIVFERATNRDKQIYEYGTPEKTATLLIYMQSVQIIADLTDFKDKEVLPNLFIEGANKLIRGADNIPFPSEKADISHAVLMRSMIIKNHIDIISSINDNCLGYLFKQDDECIDNLAADWKKIVTIIS